MKVLIYDDTRHNGWFCVWDTDERDVIGFALKAFRGKAEKAPSFDSESGNGNHSFGDGFVYEEDEYGGRTRIFEYDVEIPETRLAEISDAE